jgi:hypothetical protein
MIEQLRRAVEAKPALEPFASGRRTIDASGTANVASSSYAANNIRAWLSGDASTPSTTSANATKEDDDAFDAVAYAREAFSRSRRGGAGSGGDALDDVALLADGARTMEALIRDEVIGKRETLEEALRGVEEAEATMKTIREGANEIADAMRRVAREIGEPHESVEASTRTLERVMATGETLRGVVKVLKLTSKLRECYGGGDDETRSRDASELSKAAKLLGEVKLTLKSAGRDFDGVDVVDEQMVFIQDCSVAVSREANEALDRGMETASQADVGAALQVHYNLNELSAVVDARVASYTNAAVDAVKDAVDAAVEVSWRHRVEPSTRGKMLCGVASTSPWKPCRKMPWRCGICNACWRRSEIPSLRRCFSMKLSVKLRRRKRFAIVFGPCLPRA